MWRWIGVAVSLVVFAAALFALQRILSGVEVGDVLVAFTSIEQNALLASIGFTALSYLTLTGYDAVALHHIKRKVPYGHTALASFTSYAFSNNIGLALLTGGTIRYRIYSLEGLTAVDIAALTGISTLTFFLGALSALGIALIVEPETLSVINRLPVTLNQLIGGTMLAALALYALWVGWRERALYVRGFRLRLPGPGLTLGQIAIALADIAFASAALYMLMPQELGVSYTAFAGIFVAALTLGLLAHTPGGIGVFEAMILLALPDAPPEVILGRLILFRCVYYLLPLAVAAALLALNEVLHPLGAGRRLGNTALAIGGAAAPQIVGLLVLACGAFMLLSGAATPDHLRNEWVNSLVPPGLREAAHLIAGVTGVCLVILSRGLFRRLTRAWRFAVIALALGVAAVILRGFDFEEAVALAFVLLILLATRRGFVRRGHNRNLPFPATWVAVIATVIVFSIWIGVLIYGETGLDPATLGRFGPDEYAARFMRSSLAVVLVAVAFVGFVTLRVSEATGASATIPTAVRGLVRQAVRPMARLAFLGDKRFLIDDAERAFLMYAVHRRTWLALGTPFGAADAGRALLARFRDLAEAEGGNACLFDVGLDDAPLLAEINLLPTPIGDRAVIDLRLPPDGLPDLPAGLSARLVTASEVRADAAPIRAVYDAWRAKLKGPEPRFAHMRIGADGLPRGDVVLLERGDTPVAFASLWTGREGDAAIDVARFVPQGERQADEELLAAVIGAAIAVGAESGRATLELGLLPLADPGEGYLAPALRSAGAGFYSHGANFADPDALRRFMLTFGPALETRYIATSGGLLPPAVRDAAVLITGRRPPRRLGIGVEPRRA